MTATTKPGLFERIAAVKAGLGQVNESGHNKHLGYTYATDADIFKAVNPLLNEHGVLLFPSLRSVDHDGAKVQVIVRFRWVDAATGESAEDEWAGTGQEDKTGATGLYKAYTGALRTYLAKTFQIATGENPEDGHTSRDPASRQPTAVEASPDLKNAAWTWIKYLCGEHAGQAGTALRGDNGGKLTEPVARAIVHLGQHVQMRAEQDLPWAAGERAAKDFEPPENPPAVDPIDGGPADDAEPMF